MKLSEAIREGARLAPQIFGHMEKGGGTCALGGAVEHLMMEGLLAFGEAICTDPLEQHFPIMKSEVRSYPCGCPHVDPLQLRLPPRYAGILSLGIIHLNDYHRWSREAIAEWVEVIEKQMEPVPAADEALAGARAQEECRQTDTPEPESPVGSERLTREPAPIGGTH